jgi:hypothetical protein
MTPLAPMATSWARGSYVRGLKHLHTDCEQSVNHLFDQRGGEQEPDRPTSGRMDKGIEVAPRVGMRHPTPGHCPRGLQTRRTIGSRSMRCWSVAHSSTLYCGCACCRVRTTAGRLFKSGLRLGIGLGMAGPWELGCPAETPQHLPPPLGMDWPAQDRSHPGHPFWAGPAAAIEAWLVQRLSQLRLLGWRQQPCGPGMANGAGRPGPLGRAGYSAGQWCARSWPCRR